MTPIDELDRLAAAATPEWPCWEANAPDPIGMVEMPEFRLAHVRLVADGDDEPGMHDDLTYIAAADPTTIRALIVSWRELREALARAMGTGLSEHQARTALANAKRLEGARGER